MNYLKSKIELVVLALLMSILGNAQPGKGYNREENQKQQFNKQEMRFDRCSERMQNYLNLSDEQKTQMDKMRLNHQKEMLPLKNLLEEKKARMNSLKTAEKADLKAINALIDEISVIKTQMAKSKAAHHQEIRNVLTEEQRLNFDMHTPRRGHYKKGGKRNCL